MTNQNWAFNKARLLNFVTLSPGFTQYTNIICLKYIVLYSIHCCVARRHCSGHFYQTIKWQSDFPPNTFFYFRSSFAFSLCWSWIISSVRMSFVESMSYRSKLYIDLVQCIAGPPLIWYQLYFVTLPGLSLRHCDRYVLRFLQSVKGSNTTLQWEWERELEMGGIHFVLVLATGIMG